MLNIDDRFLTEASQDQFWLMCHIAQFMNDNAACFPSNKTLCERTGWKISKLNEVKKSCIDAAMLKAETRFVNARQSTNEYTIMTDRLSVMVNLRGKKGKQVPTATATPCHTGGTQGATLAVPQGATLATPPPTATATPEVLTSNEVLTNEVLTSEVKRNTRREIENFLTVKTEDQKGPTPNSAPPPSQFDTWLTTLTEDHRIREGFTITQKIPATLFPDYVTRFTALANTMPEKYQRRHDLTGHFLNWSRIQFQEQSKKKQENGKFTFDLNKSLSEADEWLAKHSREMAAERAMRGQ